MTERTLHHSDQKYQAAGVSYEVFVQSFCDSNGDGIGDLRGLTGKLPYLHDLGIETLWLMPIHPSPSYHKYDVTNYYEIHPDYGTLEDFKTLIREAHRLGMKIIMDLVINHCSRLHPWFTSALHPKSPYRNYFIWATLEEIAAAGTLVKNKTGDSDNVHQWNPVHGQDELYFSYFWSGMPDLNYDNPQVREEVFRIGQFWLMETGVDGFRLDAAKHLYPDERARDTQAFWKEFKRQMESCKPDVLLIGEVWSALEQQVPFAEGFSALFNFDLAYSILETIRNEKVMQASVSGEAWKLNSGSPVDLILKADQSFKQVSSCFQNATFLSNHDQERVYSFLKKNKAKAKLAASVLLTLPGMPYLYYGEEIGMAGSKPDIHLREPFIWEHGSLHNTSWMPARYQDKTPPLASQINDPASMYRHYKTLIRLRKTSEALSVGGLEPLNLHDEELLGYMRCTPSQSAMVIHHLSGKSKPLKVAMEGFEIIFPTPKNLRKKQEMIVLPPYSTIILLKTQNQYQ